MNRLQNFRKFSFLLLTLLIYFFHYQFLFAQIQHGKTLYLNGDKQYFRIPDIEELNLDGNRDLSIEFWIKPETEQKMNLFNKYHVETEDTRDSTFIGQGWIANLHTRRNYLDSTGVYIENWRLLAGYTEPGFIGVIGSTIPAHVEDPHYGDNSFYTEIIPISKDKWEHIVIVFTKNQYVAYYFNGNFKSSTGSSTNNDTRSTNGYSLNCGGYPPVVEFQSGADMCFKGNIDEIRIWNKAIDANNIIPNLNDTLISSYYSTPDSGLIGYYRLDEMENLGVGEDSLANDIRDLSYNQNHAEIMGGAILQNADFTTNVENDKVMIPDDFVLKQNYPNPFNPVTTISFDLPISSDVSLKVYSISGRLVRILLNENKNQGTHTIKWDGKNDNGIFAGSGIYFYKLKAGKKVLTRKMILLK